jgi:hypothetical protein
VPAATPLPRGPAVLTLYSAADLLTGPGCPVCRYLGEAASRYLGWFALEGHGDAATVTRLCASLGMCPRHTRGLMSQPGAACRLTALYRYLARAARDRLAGRAARLAGCPACEHDDGTVGRALDTLLEGLADGLVRDRYRELGGLCIPHLRVASVRGNRGVVAWLARTMTEAITARPAGPGWAAGTGQDADTRLVLRDALPAVALPGSGVCAACLAAGRSEQAHLAALAALADGGDCGEPDRRLLLCEGHLSDLVAQARRPGVPPLLAWQAGCLTAALVRPASAPGRKPDGPAAWLGFRRRRGVGLDDCPVCLASQAAEQRALDELRWQLRATPGVPNPPFPLCVRHLLHLKAADPWAAQVTAPDAIDRADRLATELDAAFSKGTWAHRHEARGPEMTAWRRAAAFLDGGVFCGSPPRGA